MMYEATGLGHIRDESRATLLSLRGINLGRHPLVVFGVARTPTDHRRRATIVNGTTIPISGEPVISRLMTSHYPPLCQSTKGAKARVIEYSHLFSRQIRNING